MEQGLKVRKVHAKQTVAMSSVTSHPVVLLFTMLGMCAIPDNAQAVEIPLIIRRIEIAQTRVTVRVQISSLMSHALQPYDPYCCRIIGESISGSAFRAQASVLSCSGNGDVITWLGLEEDAHYRVNCTAALSPGHAVPHAVETVQTHPARPGVVRNVWVQRALNSSLVTLSWSRLAMEQENGGELIYTVSRTEVGSNETYPTLSTDRSSTDITGLQEQVMYQFTVAAMNVAGTGPTTGVEYFNKDIVILAPTNLTASNIAAGTGVDLTWSPLPSTQLNGARVLYYEIRYGLTAAAMQSASNTTDTAFSADGLLTSQHYMFEVVAITTLGTTQVASVAITVLPVVGIRETTAVPVAATTTANKTASLSGVSAPSIANMVVTSQSLSFVATLLTALTTQLDIESPLCCQLHRVAVYGAKMPSDEGQRCGRNGTTLQWTHLEEIAEYNLQCYGRGPQATGHGEGSRSTHTVTTLSSVPSSQPPNATAELDSSTDSVRLSWTELPLVHLNGEFQNYSINLRSMLSNYVYSFKTAEFEARITGVRTDTVYKIEIAAMTTAGIGPNATLIWPSDGKFILATQPPTTAIAPPSIVKRAAGTSRSSDDSRTFLYIGLAAGCPLLLMGMVVMVMTVRRRRQPKKTPVHSAELHDGEYTDLSTSTAKLAVQPPHEYMAGPGLQAADAQCVLSQTPDRHVTMPQSSVDLHLSRSSFDVDALGVEMPAQGSFWEDTLAPPANPAASSVRSRPLSYLNVAFNRHRTLSTRSTMTTSDRHNTVEESISGFSEFDDAEEEYDQYRTALYETVDGHC